MDPPGDLSKFESGYQLAVRLEQRPSIQLHSDLFPDQPQDGLIEITGENGAGKSQLLLELIARCLLENHTASVVYITTDHHASLLVLTQYVETALRKRGVELSLRDCLKRLIVLNCYNSEQFRFTVQHLDRILADNVDVKLVAIDSLSAYYWYDRACSQRFSINIYCASLVREIADVIGERHIVVVFTKIYCENFVDRLTKVLDYSVYLKRDDRLTAIVRNHINGNTYNVILQ